jgi:hypothetical protein
MYKYIDLEFMCKNQEVQNINVLYLVVVIRILSSYLLS